MLGDGPVVSSWRTFSVRLEGVDSSYGQQGAGAAPEHGNGRVKAALEGIIEGDKEERLLDWYWQVQGRKSWLRAEPSAGAA